MPGVASPPREHDREEHDVQNETEQADFGGEERRVANAEGADFRAESIEGIGDRVPDAVADARDDDRARDRAQATPDRSHHERVDEKERHLRRRWIEAGIEDDGRDM